MQNLFDRIRREPVLVTTLVGAILNLIVAFGFELTNAQEGGILAITVAVLAFVARSKVSPAPKSHDPNVRA